MQTTKKTLSFVLPLQCGEELFLVLFRHFWSLLKKVTIRMCRKDAHGGKGWYRMSFFLLNGIYINMEKYSKFRVLANGAFSCKFLAK